MKNINTAIRLIAVHLGLSTSVALGADPLAGREGNPITRPRLRRWTAVLALVIALLPGAASAQVDEVVRDDASAQVARLHDLHAAYHESVSYNGNPLDRAEHLDLLETLFAPDATLTVGGKTFNGRDAVVGWYANSAGPFVQNHNWVALSPAFRTILQPNGNTADISFQCILVDPATNMVVGKVAFIGTAKKVGGEWVFWHMNVATASL